jgi:hypothetical protein
MMRILRSKDCGNSPKNQLVENLAVALSTGDRRTVSELVTDDVRWSIVGADVFHGREAALQELERVNGDSIVELTVEHVVTHGKSGAVNGTIKYRSRTRAFCDVFEFGNAKGTSVSQITSYRIDV